MNEAQHPQKKKRGKGLFLGRHVTASTAINIYVIDLKLHLREWNSLIKSQHNLT